MGKGKDVQPRTRRAAGPTERAARSSTIATKAADKEKKLVEAAAAARATFQVRLLGGSRPRASGAGSSSQNNELCCALPASCPHTRRALANAYTAVITLRRQASA